MVAAHRSAAVRDVPSSKGTPSVVYRIAGENFIIIIPGGYRSGYMRTCAPPFLLRGTGQRMRPFTQRGIDVENVCAVPCRPVGRMWGQTFPRAFPRPCLNRFFRDPAVAPSRRRSAGHPVPVVPAGPGGTGACADRPYGQGIHGAAFVDGIGPRAGAEPCVCPELESGRAGSRTQRNPDHMGRSGCVAGKAESDTAAARRPARTAGRGVPVAERRP